MQALEFLLSLRPALPFSIEKPCQLATNSEVRRWCNNRAVRINGEFVGWDDGIKFPITDLVFFPQSRKRKTTLF